MKKIYITTVVALLTLFLSTSIADAAPIISIDMDTSQPGVQSSGSIPNNGVIAVDIVIDGVDNSQPLNAFEFDLDFDSFLLNATSVSDGGFLLPTVQEVENDITTPDVNFAEATLSSNGADGAGVLATILFTAIAEGSDTLSINDVILSAPFGEEITGITLNNGDVTITAEDDPTVVTLTSFTAKAFKKSVLLRWETATEIDNAGFNILRSEGDSGSFTRINESLIAAEGGETFGAKYKYKDTDVESGESYSYQLKDVEFDGSVNVHEPITVTKQ